MKDIALLCFKIYAVTEFCLINTNKSAPLAFFNYSEIASSCADYVPTWILTNRNDQYGLETFTLMSFRIYSKFTGNDFT